jgi:hypothetical protein
MLASSGKAGVSASLAVVLVSLRTATTIRRVDLGPGSRSTLDISSRAIVIVSQGAHLRDLLISCRLPRIPLVYIS